MTFTSVFTGTAVVLAGLGMGCGGSADETSSTPPASFLAFATAFADFRSWTSFHSDGPAKGTQPDDVLGPRTQYINHVPPHGSAKFPIGTIIVKARESGAKQIFAGVKRGGGYNATGAVDWEWFELAEGDGGAVSIVWRGVGPPSGETYGGDPTGGCNGCHGAFADNDYVASPLLRLSKF